VQETVKRFQGACTRQSTSKFSDNHKSGLWQVHLVAINTSVVRWW